MLRVARRNASLEFAARQFSSVSFVGFAVEVFFQQLDEQISSGAVSANRVRQERNFVSSGVPKICARAFAPHIHHAPGSIRVARAQHVDGRDSCGLPSRE